MQHVLVLNASYEPLNVTTVRRAHVLVFKGKAEVLEELKQPLRSASDTFQWPHVIRLVSYVVSRGPSSGRSPGARCSPATIGAASTAERRPAGLTLDHVVPRSRGGDSVWENVVTSCAPCNLKKGNRLPEEVSMQLPNLPKPRHLCSSSASPRPRSPSAGSRT